MKEAGVTKLLSKNLIAKLRMSYGKVLMSPENTQAAVNTMEAYWRLRNYLE